MPNIFSCVPPAAQSNLSLALYRLAPHPKEANTSHHIYLTRFLTPDLTTSSPPCRGDRRPGTSWRPCLGAPEHGRARPENGPKHRVSHRVRNKRSSSKDRNPKPEAPRFQVSTTTIWREKLTNYRIQSVLSSREHTLRFHSLGTPVTVDGLFGASEEDGHGGRASMGVYVKQLA